MDQCNEEITSDTIGAVVVGSRQKGRFAVVNSFMVPEFGKLTISQFNPHDVRAEQRNDDTLGDIIICVENRKYPDKEKKKQMNKKKKSLLNQWKKLEINENGILVRKTKHRVQVVLPEKYEKVVYEELHEKMGHLSAGRVVQLARERFY